MDYNRAGEPERYDAWLRNEADALMLTGQAADYADALIGAENGVRPDYEYWERINRQGRVGGAALDEIVQLMRHNRDIPADDWQTRRPQED